MHPGKSSPCDIRPPRSRISISRRELPARDAAPGNTRVQTQRI
ncbi:Unknown protein sequence [Pseudomonas syringae pv. maculicola]|nr:Unknown protein sequence [Pseudomonas syringae pv. maculicola]KPB94203.1 Unknown protein sequence [Pseudomonas syringae pv. maculicola]KPC09348.1 Unknown protein sequence [Pseudomonas syringae pv. maculicola]KPC12015.1 Unknown protein sequence [Pseudomonas amygdali pv. lachrymans]